MAGTATRRHCFLCGAAAPWSEVHEAWTCPADGPLWILNHSSPCADAVVVRAGRVLLTRRRNDPFAGHWETPGGFQHRGEHPGSAARRELAEETGLTVVLRDVLGIYIDRYDDWRYTQTTVFVAEAADDAEVRIEAAEVTDHGWFDPADPPLPLAWDHGRRLRDLADYLATGVCPSLFAPPG